MSTATNERTGRPATGILAVGILAYGAFAASFGYFLAWFAGLDVPALGSTELSAAAAGGVNVALVAVFGVTHSIMARPSYKRRVAEHLPPSLERSVYVVVASVTLALLVWAWQPIGGTAWDVEGPARVALYGGYVAGVVVVFWVSFLLDHFHLTGVAQTWARFRHRDLLTPDLRTGSLYRWVRHPMNTGLLILCWSVPTMPGARLQAALLLTTYILVGQWLEERDLHAIHGSDYRHYTNEVPALVPAPWRRGGRR